jgi:hypothetical protein
MGSFIGINLINKMNLYTGILCLLYRSVFIINGGKLKWRAALSAVIIFSLILFLNIMFLLAIIFRPINPFITYIVFTIILIFNYIVFIRRKRFEVIEEDYKKITVLNRWLIFSFFLFLIFSAIFLGFLELKLRSTIHS